MTASGKKAAIFDLDGTLFDCHFWQGIVKHHMEHRVKVASVTAYLSTHLPLWMASKLRILGEETYKVSWGEDLAMTLKGLTGEERSRMFEWIYSDYFTSRSRHDIIAQLKGHMQEGYTTIVLSSSFSEFLELIKKKLNVDHVVGTQIEVIGGVCSGRIVKPLCFGINKTRLLNEFLDAAKLDVDFKASFAYADSIVDLPVLEMVGNPVVTYPDRKLLNLACRRGWQVLPAAAGI